MVVLKVSIIIFSVVCCTCESFKILAIFPLPIRSNHAINYKIVKELVNRGHDVTHITPYPKETTLKNLKEISVESITKIIEEHKPRLISLEKQTIFEHVQFTSSIFYDFTEAAMQHENMQKVIQSGGKYDAILMPQFLNEALLGIAHHLKAPVVLVATMPLFPWGSFLLKHPFLPSYVPHLLAPYTGHMNFWERLLNSYHTFSSILYHQWVTLPQQRALVKKYIPGEPDLYDFVNNASLLLINSHMSSYEAMPLVPNAIEIGGAHIDEPKELPEDLQKFLDDSIDGAIIFSLGSNLKTSNLPEKILDGILRAFSKLKQNIVLKWETDEIPNLPKNVKPMKWLPINDILAHPNIKSFICHGGLLSTMESIYHGVPTIGIPVFVDQKMNMAIATSGGYAIMIPFQELGEEALSKAVNQILNDPKYKENAKCRSNIMKDRPLKPIDAAMYWIEYFIRHQGASHLRYPGMDLAWFQIYLLDVAVFVLILIIMTISVIRMVLKRIFVLSSKTRDTKEKNN